MSTVICLANIATRLLFATLFEHQSTMRSKACNHQSKSSLKSVSPDASATESPVQRIEDLQPLDEACEIKAELGAEIIKYYY